MSSRVEEKQARREERLHAEAEERRVVQRQKVMRRAGFGAVAVIAVVLVTLAVVLGGNGTSAPVANHEGHGQQGGGPSVGSKAPAFALTDVVSGKQVSAASLRRSKTMLFFSEGVNCQACMIQAADLQKGGTLEKRGIKLVSVTTDKPSDLAAAAKQYGIRTPLLADPTTQMSEAYGMLGHGGMGHPNLDGHAFMLLDETGTVRWHRAYQEMYVKPAQLLRDMKAEMKA